MLPEKPGALAVPAYSAVILCGLPATESVDTLHVAVLVPVRETAQSAVVPSLNVTVPVMGLALDRDVTVAVNVMEVPYVLGFEPVVS